MKDNTSNIETNVEGVYQNDTVSDTDKDTFAQNYSRYIRKAWRLITVGIACIVAACAFACLPNVEQFEAAWTSENTMRLTDSLRVYRTIKQYAPPPIFGLGVAALACAGISSKSLKQKLPYEDRNLYECLYITRVNENVSQAIIRRSIGLGAVAAVIGVALTAAVAPSGYLWGNDWEWVAHMLAATCLATDCGLVAGAIALTFLKDKACYLNTDAITTFSGIKDRAYKLEMYHDHCRYLSIQLGGIAVLLCLALLFLFFPDINASASTTGSANLIPIQSNQIYLFEALRNVFSIPMILVSLCAMLIFAHHNTYFAFTWQDLYGYDIIPWPDEYILEGIRARKCSIISGIIGGILVIAYLFFMRNTQCNNVLTSDALRFALCLSCVAISLVLGFAVNNYEYYRLMREQLYVSQVRLMDDDEDFYDLGLVELKRINITKDALYIVIGISFILFQFFLMSLSLEHPATSLMGLLEMIKSIYVN